MTNRKMTNVAAVASIMAAGSWLYLFCHPRPPGIDRRPQEAVGEVLAVEAVKLLESGARLIVIARDAEPFLVPASTAHLDGFLRTLKKSGKSVSTMRTLKLDPLRVVGVPPGDFFDLIRQGREDDVIVSFLGPPVFDGEQLAKLGGKRPRILAVCSGAMSAQIDLKRLFDQKLLAVAVISRADAPARATPGGKQSAFEQMFKLITPTNVSELQGPGVANN